MHSIIAYIKIFHSNKRHKTNLSRIYDGTNTSSTQPPTYDNNGKSWYIWFGDDSKMSYKYILSIT